MKSWKMPSCCMRSCKNRRTLKLKNKKQLEYEKLHGKISFHRLPKDAEVRKLWLGRIESACDNVKADSCVCSLHFDDADLDKTSLYCVRLRRNALPKISSTEANDSRDRLGDKETQEKPMVKREPLIKMEEDSLTDDVSEEPLDKWCNESLEHLEKVEIKLEKVDNNESNLGDIV